MRIGWKKSDLYKALDKLEKIISKEKDTSKKFEYLKTRDSVANFLFLNSEFLTPGNPPTNHERMIELGQTITGYRTYYTLVEQVYSVMLDYGDFEYKFANLVEQNPELIPTKTYITHSQTLSMIQSFYQRFDKDCFDVLNANSNRIRINFPKPDETSTSNCFFVGGINRLFMDIMNERSIEKYYTGVHEFGHVYSFLTNTWKSYDENENFYSEVESIFPELVAISENGRYEDLYYMFASFKSYFDSGENLISQEFLQEIWVENDLKLTKAFWEELRRDDITRTVFKQITDESFTEKAPYIISFGVALELLNIYRFDKGEALRIYKEIVGVPFGTNPNGIVFKNISFGEGIHNELETMSKGLSLELKQKGFKL